MQPRRRRDGRGSWLDEGNNQFRDLPSTLSLPRVINLKFPLQPHQKYYNTQYEELGFSSLTQMKYDYTTNSHYITYTFSLFEVGRMHVLSLGVKGLTRQTPKYDFYKCHNFVPQGALVMHIIRCYCDHQIECDNWCLFRNSDKTLSEYRRGDEDEVAEWLRRWTANPMCSARVGSNPILVEFSFFTDSHLPTINCKRKILKMQIVFLLPLL